jgi:hypothetical protein
VKKFYRFHIGGGTFIEASTFEEAKQKYIDMILSAKEDEGQWCDCTCVGFDHRYSCHKWGGVD